MSYDLADDVQKAKTLAVSIPLKQGNVLRPGAIAEMNAIYGLNPFKTGQCLTTLNDVPFEINNESQSL